MAFFSVWGGGLSCRISVWGGGVRVAGSPAESSLKTSWPARSSNILVGSFRLFIKKWFQNTWLDVITFILPWEFFDFDSKCNDFLASNTWSFISIIIFWHPSGSFDHSEGTDIPLRVSSEPFDPSVGFYKPLAVTSYVIDSHQCL